MLFNTCTEAKSRFCRLYQSTCDCSHRHVFASCKPSVELAERLHLRLTGKLAAGQIEEIVEVVEVVNGKG